MQPFDRIPAGVFRKARSGDEMEQTFSLIEAATDEAGLAVVDDLPVGDLEQLFMRGLPRRALKPGNPDAPRAH